jgi:DNA-binding IclR family transcriptional regulator
LHELLSVLVGHRFVEFDSDSREYRLGIRVWECGQAYLRHRELVVESKTVMTRIASAVNETVQLAVLDDADIVYLEKVDSSQPVRLQSFVGKREPAYTTALGKALLAGLDDGEVAARHAGRLLNASTPYTITTVAGLVDEALRVRVRGFAVDNEEFAEGLRCMAVPIRSHRGAVIAALGVAVPMMRGDADQLSHILSLLVAGAIDVSRRLGCPPQVLAAILPLKERSAAEAAVRKALDRAGIPGDGAMPKKVDSADQVGIHS